MKAPSFPAHPFSPWGKRLGGGEIIGVILSKFLKMSTLGGGFEGIMVYWSSKVKPCGVPKSRYGKLSLRGNRSNLAFFDEIATHLSGARNDGMGKGFRSLNRNLGSNG